MMCATWVSAVLLEMTRAAAIWLLDSPWATSAATSSSRWVSPGGAPSGPAGGGPDGAASPSTNLTASAGVMAAPFASAAATAGCVRRSPAARSAALPEILNRVADGEEITITRHGRPVAVVVRPDILWSRSRASDLLEQAERLNGMLRAAADSPRSPGGISVEYAEELVAAIRADRDAE